MSTDSTTTRRQFLAATGGVALATAVPALARGGFHQQDGGEIRVALVGCGGRGSGAAVNAVSVKQGPVKWDMWVMIGEPGDPETDPTVLWPKDRKEFKAGTLTFTAATPQEGAECKNINYDPLVMTDGIAPTDDPVLLFRSPSYAVSFVKRLQGQ